MTEEITSLRLYGMRLITIGGWAVTSCVFLLGLLLDSDALYGAALSAMLNVLPTVHAATQRCDITARMIASMMAVLQAALLVFAMKTTGWQVDMHLYFFVALASLTIFCDNRSIFAASALIIVHHLALSAIRPDWVFSGAHGPARILIHACAVVLVASVLAYISLAFGRLLTRLRDAHERAAEQTKTLHEAQEQAEEERQKTEAIRQEMAEARQRDHVRVADDFEQSVNTVTHSVVATAKLLEKTTKALEQVAQETRKQANEVAGSAQTASEAAQTVARGVAELSDSIANIAVNVSQQKEMTTRATERASGGGQAVGSLSERSDTIGQATRAIVKIADRTSLLSLNAAIEAATAGPAGRGFTIVAQEVKALAQQAAQAATEIDALLSGVRSGTVEAERSFAAIDAVVAELDRAAIAIRRDVETQRQSADTIEGYARRAADDVGVMAERSKSLVGTAQTAQQLSKDLDAATARLLEDVRTLETSAETFTTHLRSA